MDDWEMDALIFFDMDIAGPLSDHYLLIVFCQIRIYFAKIIKLKTGSAFLLAPLEKNLLRKYHIGIPRRAEIGITVAHIDNFIVDQPIRIQNPALARSAAAAKIVPAGELNGKRIIRAKDRRIGVILNSGKIVLLQNRFNIKIQPVRHYFYIDALIPAQRAKCREIGINLFNVQNMSEHFFPAAFDSFHNLLIRSTRPYCSLGICSFDIVQISRGEFLDNLITQVHRGNGTVEIGNDKNFTGSDGHKRTIWSFSCSP